MYKYMHDLGKQGLASTGLKLNQIVGEQHNFYN